MGLKFGKVVAASAHCTATALTPPHCCGQPQSSECHFLCSLPASHKSVGKLAGSLNSIVITDPPCQLPTCKVQGQQAGKWLLPGGEGVWVACKARCKHGRAGVGCCQAGEGAWVASTSMVGPGVAAARLKRVQVTYHGNFDSACGKLAVKVANGDHMTAGRCNH